MSYILYKFLVTATSLCDLQRILQPMQVQATMVGRWIRRGATQTMPVATLRNGISPFSCPAKPARHAPNEFVVR
jgi:hypothetical protein